jgi:hypothetical protein
MAIQISRFLKSCSADGLPSMGSIIQCITNPGSDWQVENYLKQRPALRRSLESLLEAVANDAHAETEIAAYFRFKEREQRGEQPLHGQHVRDWLEAERALIEAQTRRKIMWHDWNEERDLSISAARPVC